MNTWQAQRMDSCVKAHYNQYCLEQWSTQIMSRDVGVFEFVYQHVGFCFCKVWICSVKLPVGRRTHQLVQLMESCSFYFNTDDYVE